MAQDDKSVAGEQNKGKAPAEKQTTQVDGAKEPHEKDKDGKKPVDLPPGAHILLLLCYAHADPDR